MESSTFVMLKPDAVERSLVYTIMEYFKEEGIFSRCFDVVKVTPEKIEEHYAEHIAKYGDEFKIKTLNMFDGKIVVPIVLGGAKTVIEDARRIVGETQPAYAQKGTIRGDLGLGDCYEKSTPEHRLVRNLIHASDSEEAVRREAGIWLPKYRFQ